MTADSQVERDHSGAATGTGGEPRRATPDELAEFEAVSTQMETAPAGKVLRWAVESYGSGLVFACSFQEIVLLDMALAVDPGMAVIFLDTGFHFPETLEFVEQVREHYDMNLIVTHPGPEADAWPCGTERCCEVRKVAPLDRALRGRSAWLTGLKRVDAITRSDAPIIQWDEARGMVKINPLATWTDADVAAYEADHRLLVHPLTLQGYPSIGCAPTTRPVREGQDPRSGRWADSGKTECGLHV